MSFDRENYIGQIFGTRLIVSNQCDDDDWIKIHRIIPKEKTKYRLSKCLICGNYIPVLIINMKRQPPEHCPFCSGYGQRTMGRNTNNWTKYKDVCVGNIRYKNQIVTTYIDIDDYELVTKYTWRVSKKKNKYYLVTGSDSDKSRIYLHRLILKDVQVPEGYEIDHIDGNSLNNRKNNLEVKTRLENIQNSNARIDNQIGIRGICKIKNKYKVDFSFSNKRYYFKDWNTIEEAVYCRKYAEEYFNLNVLNRNPLAKKYLTLSKEEAEKIKDYVFNEISRK